jgi:hypothetical protein
VGIYHLFAVAAVCEFDRGYFIYLPDSGRAGDVCSRFILAYQFLRAI